MVGAWEQGVCVPFLLSEAPAGLQEERGIVLRALSDAVGSSQGGGHVPSLRDMGMKGRGAYWV